jgi:O-acetyl-ADP-ribose deacetylase (regulator of RNase III)
MASRYAQRRETALVQIEAVVGDITKADTEAIVNAANSQLWMGGGVAGAIKRAAGESVEQEAMAQGPIQPGEAVVTSAGNLSPPIRWVVHAATMGPDLQTSEELVRLATASALAAAATAGARSIAMPALGTGVGGLPMERAARVMVEEAAAAGGRQERIVFVLRDETARASFVREIEGLAPTP